MLMSHFRVLPIILLSCCILDTAATIDKKSEKSDLRIFQSATFIARGSATNKNKYC